MRVSARGTRDWASEPRSNALRASWWAGAQVRGMQARGTPLPCLGHRNLLKTPVLANGTNRATLGLGPRAQKSARTFWKPEPATVEISSVCSDATADEADDHQRTEDSCYVVWADAEVTPVVSVARCPSSRKRLGYLLLPVADAKQPRECQDADLYDKETRHQVPRQKSREAEVVPRFSLRVARLVCCDVSEMTRWAPRERLRNLNILCASETRVRWMR